MIKAFKKLPFYNHIPATWKRTVREHFFIPCVRAFSRMWANVFLFATTPVRYTLSGPASLQDLPSMLICCANGLYLLDAGAIKQLLKGWYFGLTKHNGKYYVYENAYLWSHSSV